MAERKQVVASDLGASKKQAVVQTFYYTFFFMFKWYDERKKVYVSDFFSRELFLYQKEQKTPGSRLFYFCINLIVSWALRLVWGLFSKKWWTFGFYKFISKYDSILYVNREWHVCVVVPCRHNFSIKKLKGQVSKMYKIYTVVKVFEWFQG